MGVRRFYFLLLSFAFHASFAPEHDLSVQAALQIPLFWSHIDTYLPVADGMQELPATL